MTTNSSILAWRIPWTGSLASYSPWGRKSQTRLSYYHSLIGKYHIAVPFIPSINNISDIPITWQALCQTINISWWAHQICTFLSLWNVQPMKTANIQAYQPRVYIHPLYLGFPSNLDHHRAVRSVLCAIEQVLIINVFYTWQCIYGASLVASW